MCIVILNVHLQDNIDCDCVRLYYIAINSLSSHTGDSNAMWPFVNNGILTQNIVTIHKIQ